MIIKTKQERLIKALGDVCYAVGRDTRPTGVAYIAVGRDVVDVIDVGIYNIHGVVVRVIDGLSTLDDATACAPAPVVTLKNGVTVANFSSPHAFQFDDGTVLEGCDSARTVALSLHKVERELHNPNGWADIMVSFELTAAVLEAVYALQKDSRVGVIIVPLPMLQALQHEDFDLYNKCRTCCIDDRVLKTVSSSKFAI